VTDDAAAESEARGGGYRLVGAAPAANGSGCCCTYLPYVLRQY